MTECKGHKSEKYKGYVKNLVSDFKKSYGGYITVFGYMNEKNELIYQIVKPLCRFEGTCAKPISDERLKEIAKDSDELREWKKQCKNAEQFKSNIQYPKYVEKIKPSVNDDKELDPSLEAYKKLSPEKIGARLMRCYLKKTLAIMCLCECDFPIIDIFKSDVNDFKGLADKILICNPHKGRGKEQPCGKKLFIIPGEKNRRRYTRQVMEALWKMYIAERGTICCIACRKGKIWKKYCDKPSHRELEDNTLRNLLEENGKSKLVVACDKCAKDITNCPICESEMKEYVK